PPTTPRRSGCANWRASRRRPDAARSEAEHDRERAAVLLRHDADPEVRGAEPRARPAEHSLLQRAVVPCGGVHAAVDVTDVEAERDEAERAGGHALVAV